MKKVILITGISSGFGKQTSELLAAQGHIVYGTVRRDVEIKPFSSQNLKLDLTDTDISQEGSSDYYSEGRKNRCSYK